MEDGIRAESGFYSSISVEQTTSDRNSILSVERVKRGKYRAHFSAEGLRELAESLKSSCGGQPGCTT